MSDDSRAAAHFQMLQVLEGYRPTIIAIVALESGVLDLLNKSSMYVTEVIEMSKFDEDCGSRFLRALAALKFIKIEDELCELDEAGLALISSPLHLRERALLVAREYIGSWLHLPGALRSGKSGFEHYRASTLDAVRDIWAHRENDAALGAAFNTVMRSNVNWVLKAVSDFPFDQYHSVVDVGGGDGTILKELLKRFPLLEGTVFDRSWVLESVESEPRFKVTVGDFFRSNMLQDVAHCDLFMLCNVLHDWDDVHAREILRAVFSACIEKNRPRILVVERILGDKLEPVDALRDLHMMAVTGGKQRSLTDLAALFDQAGLLVDKHSDQWVLAVPK
jgi:hypothetical protein